MLKFKLKPTLIESTVDLNTEYTLSNDDGSSESVSEFIYDVGGYETSTKQETATHGVNNIFWFLALGIFIIDAVLVLVACCAYDINFFDNLIHLGDLKPEELGVTIAIIVLFTICIGFLTPSLYYMRTKEKNGYKGSDKLIHAKDKGCSDSFAYCAYNNTGQLMVFGV